MDACLPAYPAAAANKEQTAALLSSWAKLESNVWGPFNACRWSSPKLPHTSEDSHSADIGMITHTSPLDIAALCLSLWLAANSTQMLILASSTAAALTSVKYGTAYLCQLTAVLVTL